MVAFATAIIELARADASVAITMAAHNSLGRFLYYYLGMTIKNGLISLNLHLGKY
ncbi:hypothetical protein Ct9H90mP29_08920 [bacterium]|nr:MAG: hypothetical protein Ct9H90mP29_08920 [bacterium]